MNKITGDSVVPAILSIIGGKTYSLLHDSLAPTLPEACSKKKLLDTLNQHYTPKPLIIAEHFKFHQRCQSPEESVTDYLAELRRLTTHCKFGNHLHEALRDRLVCGLRSEATQKRQLTKPDLTLDPALELAQDMEAATQNAKSQSRPSTPLVRLKPRPRDDKQSQLLLNYPPVTIVVVQTISLQIAGISLLPVTPVVTPGTLLQCVGVPRGLEAEADVVPNQGTLTRSSSMTGKLKKKRMNWFCQLKICL